MPADPFAKHRSRQRRHDEGGKEEDRRGLVELQIFERQKIERGGAEQEHASQELMREFARRQGPDRRSGAEHRGDQGRVHGEAHPDDLQDRHMGDRGEIFRARIEKGEEKRRHADEANRGKPGFGEDALIHEVAARNASRTRRAPEAAPRQWGQPVEMQPEWKGRDPRALISDRRPPRRYPRWPAQAS